MAKSNYRYEFIIYWSDDDQSYIAEVPELPGCAADGSTPQLALARLNASLRNGFPPRESWAVQSRSPADGYYLLNGLTGLSARKHSVPQR